MIREVGTVDLWSQTQTGSVWKPSTHTFPWGEVWYKHMWFPFTVCKIRGCKLPSAPPHARGWPMSPKQRQTSGNAGSENKTREKKPCKNSKEIQQMVIADSPDCKNIFNSTFSHVGYLFHFPTVTFNSAFFKKCRSIFQYQILVARCWLNERSKSWRKK